jgi:xanthine dehydrogenase accessory factor
VGRELAHCFERLPVRAVLIDSREDEMMSCHASVEKRLTPLPEAEIRAAPPGSAFVVLTHDHALDFLLTSEALARRDAAYVGMIGSATKRAKFARFSKDLSPRADLRKLTCPIGSTGSADKRPEVIAAFVAAEIMEVLTTVNDKEIQSVS